MSNQESYNTIANQFAADRARSRVPGLVVDFAQHFNLGDHILDVGCGAGIPIAAYLATKGLVVTGIDISQKLVEKAQDNLPSATFSKSDILTYQSREQFDGIVAWDSLFHLGPTEHEAALYKLHALLKNGGYLAFSHGGTEAELASSMYGADFTYSSPGPDKLLAITEGLGFEIETWEVDTSEGHGYMKALVRKRLSASTKHAKSGSGPASNLPSSPSKLSEI